MNRVSNAGKRNRNSLLPRNRTYSVAANLESSPLSTRGSTSLNAADQMPSQIWGKEDRQAFQKTLKGPPSP